MVTDQRAVLMYFEIWIDFNALTQQKKMSFKFGSSLDLHFFISRRNKLVISNNTNFSFVKLPTLKKYVFSKKKGC